MKNKNVIWTDRDKINNIVWMLEMLMNSEFFM